MTDFNPRNERVKRAYGHYQREALGRSETTIQNALYAIARYERFTGLDDFKTFNSDRALAYRKHLLSAGGKRAAEQSSRATVHSNLMTLRVFFRWLALQPGYKKSVDARDAEFFNLTARDAKIAKTTFEKPAPTLEQARAACLAMPYDSDVDKRDRAMVALVLLTGTRVKALTTLKLKHLRPDGRGINQDAREVHTKGGKSYPAFFVPVGDDIAGIFLDYVEHLRTVLGFGNDDPLFPSTKQSVGADRQFRVVGLTRSHWLTTEPVREAFRRAYAAANLPYFHPHSIRKTQAVLAEQRCRTTEEFKAWSQNLGHDKVLTTLTSYGAVKPERQAQLLHNLGAAPSEEPDVDRLLEQALRMLRDRKGS